MVSKYSRPFAICSYVFCIIANLVVGNTNRVISAAFPTPITPPNWAFSIWFPIFTLQGYSIAKSKDICPLWSIGFILIGIWQLLFTILEFTLCIPVLITTTACFYRSATISTECLQRQVSLLTSAWLASATSISLFLPLIQCQLPIHMEVVLSVLGFLEMFAFYTNEITYSITMAWTFTGVYFANTSCTVQYFSAQAIGGMLANIISKYRNDKPTTIDRSDSDTSLDQIMISYNSDQIEYYNNPSVVESQLIRKIDLI